MVFLHYKLSLRARLTVDYILDTPPRLPVPAVHNDRGNDEDAAPSAYSTHATPMLSSASIQQRYVQLRNRVFLHHHTYGLRPPADTVLDASVPPLTRSVNTNKADSPQASNIKQDGPQSDSPEEQSIKTSRGKGEGIQDSASVAEPTSQVGSGAGQDEEGGAPGTKDPNKPASQKSAEVQKEGMKPLDAADK